MVIMPPMKRLLLKLKGKNPFLILLLGISKINTLLSHYMNKYSSELYEFNRRVFVSRILREKRRLRTKKDISRNSSKSNSDVLLALNDNRSNTFSIAEQISSGPLFSIILTIHDPLPEHLEESIESVVNQSYQNWELCIFNNGNMKPGIRKVLEKYSSNRKIIIQTAETPVSRSTALNKALEKASGDWIISDTEPATG